MAGHAPTDVAADSAELRQFRRLEFFPTPPWAARAGAEIITMLDPGDWTAEEPACGQGHCAHGLKDYFRTVATADVFDHGWDGQDRIQDFLSNDRRGWAEADWIITNPPFKSAADFVRIGLKRARRGVAILARQSLLESAGRYDLFFGAETPMKAYAPFFERVPMVLGRWDPKGSTATAYAWFIWMRPELRHPGATWPAIVKPIGPGTKARLTKPDDARLFGHRGEMTLLAALDA